MKTQIMVDGKDEPKVLFAGISIINGAEIRFHTTNLQEKVSGWFHVPGHAQYTFIKLPRLMTKLAACKFMLKHKDFQNPKIQRFLKTQVERRELGVPVNPRNYIVTRSQMRSAAQRIKQFGRAVRAA